MLFVNGSFADKPLTGVQRYAFEMCLALKGLGVPFRIIAPQPVSLPEYDSLNDRIEVVPKSALGKLLRWEQGDLSRYMLGRRRDILWNPSNLAVMGPFRQITTVHDLAVYQDEKWFDWKFAALYKLYTPYTLRASERILTVSGTIKAEIAERFRIPEAKITVIPNGARPPRPADLPGTGPVPDGPYLLILGSRDPRKNLGNALRAWARVRKEAKGPVKLRVVGGSVWSFAQGNEAAREDQSVVFMGRVSDAELEGLLRGCLGKVYLSRYEGFGLPVLEALARNKLCLISDIPVFRELFGEGCAFVDPEDVEAIARGMEGLLEKALSERSGPDFAEGYLRKYDWRASARALGELAGSAQRDGRH
jgi:glycosyltransferase involved in cell wall biosynthesis